MSGSGVYLIRRTESRRSMPQMDGYDLLGHVRELALEDAAPVIALTAHSDAEERQKALKAAFARFLTKPVGSAIANLGEPASRALDPAIAEINKKTDLNIALESLGRSKHRRVTTLTFSIKAQARENSEG